MKTRVLVVDDSRFMRTVLSKELSERGYDVVTARDGNDAIDAVEEYRPDVITMDVHMPKMDGLEASKEIMERFPTPIIMLSAHTKSDAEITLDALDAGVVDFITKPGGEVSINVDGLIDRLIKLLDTATQVDLEAVTGRPASDNTDRPAIQQEKPDTPQEPPSIDEKSDGELDENDESPVIVIGASTGGPRIIENILREIPRELNARILVIQHMPENFTSRLAKRMDRESSYTVYEAEDGKSVNPGDVIIAKGGYHLVAEEDNGDELSISLDDGPRLHGLRPAIDVTMESVAEAVSGPIVGVVLTGMGRDGAKGIKRIKQAGGLTIAQNRETSPVFGIPQRAIETGHVDTVLPDTRIVRGVVEELNMNRGEQTHG